MKAESKLIASSHGCTTQYDGKARKLYLHGGTLKNRVTAKHDIVKKFPGLEKSIQNYSHVIIRR